MWTKPARQPKRTESGNQREQNVGRVKRDLGDVLEDRQQQRQIAGVERRMRMSPHVHDSAHECIARMRGMQRIDLRVLRSVEIVDVVALNRLIQEGKPQSQYEQRDDNEFPAQDIKIAKCIFVGSRQFRLLTSTGRALRQADEARPRSIEDLILETLSYGILRSTSSKKFRSTETRLMASCSSRASGCGAITILLPSGDASKFWKRSRYSAGVGAQVLSCSVINESP